MKFFHHKVTT